MNIKFPFMDIPTDVTIIARRGHLLYGVAMKPNFSVVMVTLVLHGDDFDGLVNKVQLLETNQTVYANVILGNDARILENHIRTSVSCFIHNAFLDDALREPLAKKIAELVEQIPAPKVFKF